MNREGVSQGLGLIPSGVFVLAAAEGDQKSAMLASFVQQASFDPPTIVVAVAGGRPIRSMIENSGTFVLAIMGPDSKDSLKRFWKGVPEGEDPFEGLGTRTFDTGIRVPADAIGFLECKFKEKTEAGDPIVFVGEVTNGGRLEEGEPMVRIRKNGFEY